MPFLLFSHIPTSVSNAALHATVKVNYQTKAECKKYWTPSLHIIRNDRNDRIMMKAVDFLIARNALEGESED